MKKLPTVAPTATLVANATPSKSIRKSHTKSRRGCYNCKRRKIKCPENHPSCQNCIKVKLDCQYPPQSKREEIHSLVPYLLETVHLQSTPVKFSMTDMRLFNHFILNAYPHLPLGNDKVWITDVASFAHSYDFLIHSVLGLAASHLTMVSTSPLSSVALSHRVLAIKGLNKAMSTPPKTGTDSDSILAACYALAMQSSYIGESIEEFLTLLRGCQIVMAQRWPEQLGSVFHSLDSDCQLQLASSKLSCLPTVAPQFIEVAKASVEQLGQLCVGVLEKWIQCQLLEILTALENSSREAYFNYSTLCSSLSALPQTEFEAVTDASNSVMQILLAHWAGILVLIYPIKACEWSGRDMGIPNRWTVFQIDSIYNNIPSNLRRYLEWPLLATGSSLGRS